MLSAARIILPASIDLTIASEESIVFSRTSTSTLLKVLSAYLLYQKP